MDWLSELKTQGQTLKTRAFGHHLRVGITGLSGAGKTAFITSLIQQLLHPSAHAKLPFFSVMQQQRWHGAKLLDSQSVKLPRFSYEQNLAALFAEQWPASTTGLSQISLNLRYQSNDFLASKLLKFSELQLDIVDYPGEWLLDLPMLQQDYSTWSAQCWSLLDSAKRAEVVAPFLQALQQANLAQADDWSLQQLSERYAQLLQQLRTEHHAILLQPGRLLLPGALQGTPLLWLFPLLPSQCQQHSPLFLKMQQQYQRYCQQVVKPFYQDFFVGLDRQVVLVDCLGALNHGFAATQETQLALMQILQNFRYGTQNFFTKLFRPKIDKILFAATKADLVTPDQHQNLALLLQQFLQQPLQDSQYQLVKTEALPISAVVTSELGMVQTEQGAQVCLRGNDLNGQQRVLFPGEVPISMPSELLFAHHQFSFPHFRPPRIEHMSLLASQRMDQALEFLLGDQLS